MDRPGHEAPVSGAPVELYWLPLGAGGPGSALVRFSGRVYEALHALFHGHRPHALYHSALLVRAPDGRFAIELGPVPDGDSAGRGVACVGAVGSRWLGRFRWFRYELRCWREGTIPDVDQAVASPQRLSDDPAVAQRLLELTRSVPPAVWGRDELGAGEMWNSNAVISWLIVRSGVPPERATLPPRGRAPGWDAGVVVAGRNPGVVVAGRNPGVVVAGRNPGVVVAGRDPGVVAGRGVDQPVGRGVPGTSTVALNPLRPGPTPSPPAASGPGPRSRPPRPRTRAR